MSTLQLYNTLSRTKQVFKPIQAGKVGIYVCGMTVYDYCHIGHARVIVGFDVIVRWLRHQGYAVNYVRNITDIDDKIITRALENNESINELTQRFITAMHEDEAALGCLSPDQEPRATAHIDDMQAMIATLIDKGHAYAGQTGDVYYAVETFESYGKLSGRKLADMQAGSRVEVDNDKHNPFDFVLWKAAKPDEPQWDSPWGQGRPGWHIECSAMSQCCLGEQLDIHGGGHDLTFPHHENEIAQSEAATETTYANHWMHVGFVNVDGEKMSKSLGNFFTIREILARFTAETLRFFIISSHYRSPINFSDKALAESHAGLTRLYQALKMAEATSVDAESPATVTQHDAQDYSNRFATAMNDDFNTADAISVLFGMAKDIQRAVNDDDADKATYLAKQLRQLAEPLGILQQSATEFLQQGSTTDDAGLTASEIEAAITDRITAKQNKDYQGADAIRAQLKQQGVELEDGKDGTTWRRV